MREGSISSCLAGAVLLSPDAGREVARGHGTGKMSPWAGTTPGPACCEGKAGFVPSVIIWFHGAPLFAFFFFKFAQNLVASLPFTGVFSLPDHPVTARPASSSGRRGLCTTKSSACWWHPACCLPWARTGELPPHAALKHTRQEDALTHQGLLDLRN